MVEVICGVRYNLGPQPLRCVIIFLQAYDHGSVHPPHCAITNSAMEPCTLPEVLMRRFS